jgi:hypothetical protein
MRIREWRTGLRAPSVEGGMRGGLRNANLDAERDLAHLTRLHGTHADDPPGHDLPLDILDLDEDGVLPPLTGARVADEPFHIERTGHRRSDGRGLPNTDAEPALAPRTYGGARQDQFLAVRTAPFLAYRAHQLLPVLPDG